MTPQPGLHRWRNGRWQAVEKPSGEKPILLFIHGAFGDKKLIFDQLQKVPEGRDLLQRAARHYGSVLAFDHPTLSVSPVLNALDLSRLFATSTAPLDMVCHGRGGLVARWWLECFRGGAERRERVILVGSPLGGTSLANPPRLRAALGLITNVGHALSMGSDKQAVAVPLLRMAIGLIKVITSITSLGAKAPLMEASIAMIPGLAGQTREGNRELRRLHKKVDNPLPEYSAVRCNFEPSAAAWVFQKHFVKAQSASGAAAADTGLDWVFQDQNDIVVDSASMTELFDSVKVPEAKTYDFGTTDRVHHLNYFQQPETIRFIAQSLNIP
jgi:pimeloyl-ACP methyl ester carboxylesterase